LGACEAELMLARQALAAQQEQHEEQRARWQDERDALVAQNQQSVSECHAPLVRPMCEAGLAWLQVTHAPTREEAMCVAMVRRHAMTSLGLSLPPLMCT
jgi:hypothetical protein